MSSWQVGAVRITQVVESKGASPPSFFFPDVTVEDVQRHAWLRPHFAHRDGQDVSAGLFEAGLCLHSGSNLTPEQIGRVIGHLHHAFDLARTHALV